MGDPGNGSSGRIRGNWSVKTVIQSPIGGIIGGRNRNAGRTGRIGEIRGHGGSHGAGRAMTDSSFPTRIIS